MSFSAAFINTLIGVIIIGVFGVYAFPPSEGQDLLDFRSFVIITLLISIILELKQIKK